MIDNIFTIKCNKLEPTMKFASKNLKYKKWFQIGIRENHCYIDVIDFILLSFTELNLVNKDELSFI